MSKNEISPLNYALNKIEHFKGKANHNKRESLWGFRLIMTFSLISPVFVAYGEGDLYSKILPSIFSLCAALGTAWLQLRKPQELWSLYRTYQRQIENEVDLYSFDVTPYQNVIEKDQLLVKNVSSLVLQSNSEWRTKVPQIEQRTQEITSQ